MAIKKVSGSRLVCKRVQFRSRKPVWNAKSVGRVACYARSSGSTVDELLAELQKCAPCKTRRSKRAQAQMEAALTENNGVLGDADIVLTGLNVALDGFLLLSRFVPMLRAPALAVQAARRPLAAVTTRIRARRAANDELYESIKLELAG